MTSVRDRAKTYLMGAIAKAAEDGDLEAVQFLTELANRESNPKKPSPAEMWQEYMNWRTTTIENGKPAQ